MPLVSAMARNMTTHCNGLRQNHRRRQEVGLLCGGLYSVVERFTFDLHYRYTINQSDVFNLPD
jgi:hypothetical protein